MPYPGFLLAHGYGHIGAHAGAGGTGGAACLTFFADLGQRIALFGELPAQSDQLEGTGDYTQPAPFAEFFVNDDLFHRQTPFSVISPNLPDAFP
jgi:hypothetical protein